MTLAMHCARPWTEANYGCDVSFERTLITSRPRARSYHPEKENSDGKSLKLSASLAVVMKSELQKHRRERQIIDRSFDGNFGEFGPFLWDLWSFELERSASESPCSLPIFLAVSTTQNLQRRLNGSRGKETVSDKTQTQGKSFLFLFLSKIGI